MKPLMKGWKEGVITKDLVSVGGNIHKKGSIVRYKKYLINDELKEYSSHKYEWHYLDQDNSNLIRSSELLIE